MLLEYSSLSEYFPVGDISVQDGKFPLGRIVITAAANEALVAEDIEEGLLRHSRADWGDVHQYDRNNNELALANPFAHLGLFSIYHSTHDVSNQTKFWIMTEPDRAHTIVLLPDEF